MSYQVLARKWRPRSFDDVVGQDHVTVPLRNAIKRDRVAHALLLTGPRGVGKTTLARILARCLNCDSGPTETPCDVCTSCVEISDGRSPDVQEIDAASRTSVDDVREIIESVRYAPTPGKTRIYVIDEVHMLSTAAFNALLKTLEEPPPRSVFVLATTNPEKIPYTVVSRCQRYDLRRVPTGEIVARLRAVADAEGAELEDASLAAIARSSEGSLRDALTLLDQILASEGEATSHERVAEVLDLIDREVPLSIVEACIAGDSAAALAACRRADDAGIDARRLAGELLHVLRDLVVIRVAPSEEGLVDAAEADLSRLRDVADRDEPLRLRRMFRALVREQEDLAFAPDGYAVLEMAVVRLATLPPGDDVRTLLSRLDALERSLRGDGGPPTPSGGPGDAGSRGRGGGRRKKASGGKPSAEPAPAPSAGAEAASGTAAEEAPSVEAAPQAGAETLHPAEASPGSVYDRLRQFAVEQNRGLFAGLAGGALLERSEDAIRIALPGGIAAERIRARKADLEAICRSFFGRPIEVELEIGNGREAGRTARPDDGALRETRKAALHHEAINTALEVLEAEIVEIRPLGAPR